MSDLNGTETTGEYGDPEPRSEGGGLRKQLEQFARENAELKQKLEQDVPAAEQRGAQRAQRRFEVLEIVGKDRPGLADTFVEKNPEWDGTKDSVVEYARSFGVTLDEQQAPAEPQVAPEVVSAAQAFQTQTPVVNAASEKYTPEQVRQIGLSNQTEALRIIGEGLME